MCCFWGNECGTVSLPLWCESIVEKFQKLGETIEKHNKTVKNGSTKATVEVGIKPFRITTTPKNTNTAVFLTSVLRLCGFQLLIHTSGEGYGSRTFFLRLIDRDGTIVEKKKWGNRQWLKRNRFFTVPTVEMKRPDGRGDALPAVRGIPSKSILKSQPPLAGKRKLRR